jgi:type VI secretion system protein ImpC
MSKEWGADFRLTADASRTDAEARECRSRGPFVITVLADLYGAAATAGPERSSRCLPVDIDNFDAVLRRFRPAWRGTLASLPESSVAAMELDFAKIDDFHPDEILRRLPPLRTLLETRAGLADPSRFAATAERMKAWLPERTAAAAPPKSRPPLAAAGPDSPGLLDQILAVGETEAAIPSAIDDLGRYVEAVVAPHLLQVDTSHQRECLAVIDQALAAQLRGVLHDPAWQRIEGAWRGLHWLVHRVGGSDEVKILLLHRTKADLRGDASNEPAASSLFHALVEQEDVPPALLVGLHQFGGGADDLEVLRFMASLARQVGAPFVTAADPQLLGLQTFAAAPPAAAIQECFDHAELERWRTFRRTADARWCALALPRFLGRLPYGSRTSSIETFDFTELTEPVHEQLLWFNPSLAVAEVAARAFAQDGWNLDVSREVQYVEDLPVYVDESGETAVMQPVAETWLSDAQVRALQDAGMLPLVSLRGRDAVALPSLQSIAEPRSAIDLQVQ